MRVLLVEHGANRGTLAAARALHRAGWRVDVLGSGAGLTQGSRSVRSRTAVDFPACGADGLAAAVREVTRRTGSEIVLPVDETQMLALSEHRDALGAMLPLPAHEVVTRATDRIVQARAAGAAGLAPPRTVPATDPAALDGAADAIVVKARTPRLHPVGTGWGRFETRIGTLAEARGWCAEIAEAGIEAVVQERLEGPLASMTVLTGADGRLVAQMQQEAETIWPVGAGTSARARTVRPDPRLTRRVLDFLERLGWHGFAQLQFLVSPDGTFRLIDFNPRFYGSLSLAIGAGVDFPAVWAAMVTGRPVPRALEARPGVRYQWLGGDLRRAVLERRGGLGRDVAGSLLWGARAVKPVWSPSDPAPAVRCGLRFLRNRV